MECSKRDTSYTWRCMQDKEMEDIKLMIDQAKLYVKGLRMGLVSRTDPAQVSVIAKIPYKVIEIREALLYRATDLADASCLLFEEENLVSAACITRAFQETLAVLFFINRKVKKAINDKDLQHLDGVLMKTLMGSKNNPDLPDPVNILTMIDWVDKEIPSFRAVYDNLSELSHPNWAGTFGIYTKTNKEKVWTDFGRNIKLGDTTKKQIAITLYAGLELIVHIYEEFAVFMPDLVKICEDKLRSEGNT